MSDDQLELWQGYMPMDLTKKEPNCECGTHSVMGKVGPEFHSDYCPVVKALEEAKSTKKKIEDLYGVVIT